MTDQTHDIGYLKRVDRLNGTSKLVDSSGNIVAVVKTSVIASTCQNLDIRRFRITYHHDET